MSNLVGTQSYSLKHFFLFLFLSFLLAGHIVFSHPLETIWGSNEGHLCLQICSVYELAERNTENSLLFVICGHSSPQSKGQDQYTGNTHEKGQWIMGSLTVPFFTKKKKVRHN